MYSNFWIYPLIWYLIFELSLWCYEPPVQRAPPRKGRASVPLGSAWSLTKRGVNIWVMSSTEVTYELWVLTRWRPPFFLKNYRCWLLEKSPPFSGKKHQNCWSLERVAICCAAEAASLAPIAISIDHNQMLPIGQRWSAKFECPISDKLSCLKF